MRKLGLIGGMSWVSTRGYYEDINRIVQKAKGPQSSAPLLIESLDFAPLYRLSTREDWDKAAKAIGESANRLETAGAEAIVIAANSMHCIVDRVAEAISIPILHIADCVADAMIDAGAKKAAILGTRNVMLEEFYRRRLLARDIELLPPQMDIVETIDRIVYEEVMLGKVRRQSERELRTIITNLEKDGAEAVVLACTELNLIVHTDANVLPIFDGAEIHAVAAARWILGEG
ncbi:aspartate/glutamate racemase family protein [Croceicoccus bisphenolivorans]|uniref:aspartate/glutamate racemase family protein n=1 Tax=Croceicoccus bisphenolivorans TaxID=1783232 RepID=UPI00082A7394|nr:amino acid racemase [Croceicoccus bisphenolivorans]